MTRLYKFQRRGVEFIDEHNGRALLGDQPGLGKTIQSLTWAKWSRCRKPIIVVCPAGAKYHWQAEALRHINLRSEILYGRKPPKQARLELNKHPMFIINYDILHWWVPYLKKLKPGLIIIDEAHRVKSPRAKSAKAINKLGKGVPHIIALTGTPLENNPVEIWHIMSILQPKRKEWKRGYYSFAHRFSNPKLTRWGWVFKGARNRKKLHRILTGPEGCMLRRLKQDVLQDLPPKTKSVLVVEMDDPAGYQLAVRDFTTWYNKNKPKGRSKASRSYKANQRAKLSYLKQLAGKKLKAVTEWIDSFLTESNEKLIVFAIHRALLEELHNKYPNSVLLYGGIPTNKRKHIIAQFNDDPKVRLMFGNLHAAGVFWSSKHPNTLTIERDWKPSTHEQADDRAHGLFRGGGQPTFNYHMIAKGSLEESICKMHSEKQAIIDGIVDGKFEKGVGEFDIYNALSEALLKSKNGFIK